MAPFFTQVLLPESIKMVNNLDVEHKGITFDVDLQGLSSQVVIPQHFPRSASFVGEFFGESSQCSLKS